MTAIAIITWTTLSGLLIIFIFAIARAEYRDMARVTLFGSNNQAPSSGATFDITQDMPSMAGKVVLITGAAGDLGRQTAIELARHGRPACIYIADLPRDQAAQKGIIDRVFHEAYGDSSETMGTDTSPRTEIRFLDLDLTSFESIRACVAEFLAREKRLDVLLLNAGIIRVRTGQTTEGYEVHFGLNYVGHALLAKLLVPTMVHTAQKHTGTDARMVVVSSEGHAMSPKGGIQFDKLKTDCAQMSYAQRYGQSKLALIALTKQMAHRYPELKVASVHPGRIITGMAAGLAEESLLVRLTKPIAPYICVPVAIGILNHLWAATSPDVVSGTYYEPVGVAGKESALAKDNDLSMRLWEWTEGELKDVKPLK
ncbi:NAD(P)-binding protein [Amniculicola lignicola CBS 123094]|uniref:NAD(P)-binding protein n=1 Tax=Amniculicola lignicola CBS 123094 TaxID=1392246 RepID=A0A6A5WDM0_9PLEO|nr:NAD(P)-binding protein [Amniculicola lignicola CBS 123094]